jgi:hypothetical protein
VGVFEWDIWRRVSHPKISVPGWGADFDRLPSRDCDFRASAIRDVGTGLRLFRTEFEHLELPAPFSRQIAEPLDADAGGQATLNGSFDKIGR